MADNDRYRHDRGRYRDRDDSRRGRDREEFGGRGSDIYGRSADYGHRDDDGYIARRGFGNESAGYGRGGRSGFERGGYSRRDEDDRYRYGHERDFGDSAGYGTGGSTRDWRDVMGEDRDRGGTSYGTGYDRSRERGYGGGYGAGPRGREDLGRYGASDFGRGSRGDQDERGFFERMGDEVRSWFGEDDDRERSSGYGRTGEVQHHRGRGPKNYTRSDDRIREDVNDRLTDDPHVDASEIEVIVQNREVTLSGTVNSRFEKRHAEDIADNVPGVTHVQNNLRVQMSQGSGMDAGTAMSGGAQAGTASHGTSSTGSRSSVVGGATGTTLGGGEVSTPDQAGDAARGRRRNSTTSGT
jgi:osmotically-inducible protein OsmY